MIAYQLGWMNLLLNWESQEQKGNRVIVYRTFYKQKLSDLLSFFVYRNIKPSISIKFIKMIN